MPTLHLGFIPLLDCSLLVIAQEKNFFASQGLRVELHKAQSWGAIHDNLIEGKFDAAHLLLTMPLQSNLQNSTYGLESSKERTKANLSYAFTLSHNGNGIILANEFWNEGVRDAMGLARYMAANPQKKIRFGVVYPRGTQEYFLRSWLMRGGLSLDGRIELTIIAPQEMVGRLRKGEIDGFCVGAPWSQRAAASKLGRIVSQSHEMHPGLGEKVLGVRSDWHESHKNEHAGLLRALSFAAKWLTQDENLIEAVEILASKPYINTPKIVVQMVLQEQRSRKKIVFDQTENFLLDTDLKLKRLILGGPHFPARTHAQWYLEQMHRFGHAGALASTRIDLTKICLEEFYRQTISSIQPNENEFSKITTFPKILT